MRENIKRYFGLCGNFQTELLFFLLIVWGHGMKNMG